MYAPMADDAFSLIEAQPDSAPANSADASSIASFWGLMVITGLRNLVVSIDAAE